MNARLPRLGALAALAAATGAPGASHALSCPLLPDPPKDVLVLNQPGNGAVSDPAVDLLGVDIASDSRGVAVALRVAGLDGRDPVPVGLNSSVGYGLTFRVNGSVYRAFYSKSTTGQYADFTADFLPMPFTLEVDGATSTVTWRMPRASLPTLERGSAFTQITARTSRTTPTTSDHATGPQTYTDRDAACIAVR